MAFKNLSARITGDATSYVSATKRAQHAASEFGDAATSLAARLQVLQGRADEAGEEVSGLGRRALTASLGVRSLSSSLPTLNLGLISVSGTLTGVLLPALALLSTTLFPLAAIAGTVGAALAGLGLGVFAGTAAAAASQTEALTAAFNEMVAGLQDALAPLAEAFVPLLMAIMDRIPRVVQEIVALTGGFREFRNAIWGVADAFFDLLPQAIATLYRFGRLALPILKDFLTSLEGRIVPALHGMLGVTRELAPELIAFGKAFVDAIPELTRLGTVVLETVVPALTGLMGVVENLLSRGFGGGAGGLIQGLLGTLMDGLQTAATWLKNGGGKEQITAFITSLFGAMETAIGDEGETADAVVSPLLSIIGSVFDSLVTALRSDEATGLAASIGELATEALQLLADKLISYASSQAFRDDLAGLTAAIANSVGVAIGAGIANAFEFGSVRVLEDGPTRTGPGLNPESGTALPSQRVTERGGSLDVNVTGTLTMEDGELVAKIDDEVRTKLREQAQQSQLQ